MARIVEKVLSRSASRSTASSSEMHGREKPITGPSKGEQDRLAKSAKPSFPSEVAAKLGYYVYRLIDPRDGDTFYVGKGKGNRVFEHAAGEIESEEDSLSTKLKRIREIRLAGFDVSHVIHRHGLDEKTAFEVEAALIDAYAGVTNEVGGAGSDDRGVMHVKEITRRYKAEIAVFNHKVVLISVNRTAVDMSLYDATRFAWRLNPSKASRAEYVLATRYGIIVGAFVAEQWLPATAENFLGRNTVEGRWGFVGHEAPANIVALYLSKRVPDSFRKRGNANPILYSYQ